MRKTAVLLGLAFASLTAAPVAAQDTHIGLRGGLIVSGFSDDNFNQISGKFSEADPGTGFNVGLFADIPFGERFAIQPGVNFQRKGGEVEPLEVQSTIKIDYFEVPILGRIGLVTGDDVTWSIYAGPSLAFEAACNVDTVGEEDLECETATDPGGDPLFTPTKSFDLGGKFGTGVSFSLSDAGSLWFDGFYTLGLQAIDDGAQDLDIKNQAFEFDIGVSFVVGG